MSQNHRNQKTLARKLSDLDDHLYFLKESLAKLAAGDDAYIKTLSAELRVLVCKSSGTEGLLWRILDELEVHDKVYIYHAKYIAEDFPMEQGIQLKFSPIWRPGQLDPKLVPEYYSLKKIIKECKAVVVSGKGYTHEKLILCVAQQMGSAHEDEGVEPYLVELCETIVSNQRILNSVLLIDADMVLEVGEKALVEAAQKVNFVRSDRPKISIVFSQRTNFASVTQGIDFVNSPPPLQAEGTMFFPVTHPHEDWMTNSDGYNFGPFTHRSLSVKMTKHPDKTLEIYLNGIGSSIISTRQIIPDPQQSVAIIVAIAWNEKKVIFYLGDEVVDTIEFQ
jgi:hypothetical protein